MSVIQIDRVRDGNAETNPGNDAMPGCSTKNRQSARYALQLSGEQVEHGLTENAFSFQASISSLTGQADLSAIHGLLIEHECGGDFCVDLRPPSDARLPYELADVFHGSTALECLPEHVGVQARVSKGGILFLHHPTVIDIDDRKQPGTRLIHALRRHFAGRPLDVVIDLGTSETDTTFNDYFFPDLNLLGLHFLSARLVQGRWGRQDPRETDPIGFGVVYGPA